MATRQTIIWTALPNGWATEAAVPTVKLSVFVSPRLETDEGLPKPTLSQFPDLLEWTAKVKEITFAVQFGSGAPIPATRVGPELEPELWGALSKSSTYVKPYESPKLAERNIRSHPVQNVNLFLKAQYQSVATSSPAALPRIDALVGKLAPVTLYTPPAEKTTAIQAVPQALQAMPDARRTAKTEPKSAAPAARGAQVQLHPQAMEVRSFTQTLHPRVRASAVRDLDALVVTPNVALKPQVLDAFKSVAQDLHRHRAVPPTTAPQPTKDFLQVALFHRPRAIAKVPLQVPEIDFHQFLSTLGNYPELMRRLGLVIDLEVPVPDGFSASETVRVIPTWMPALGASTDFTPKTAYIADRAAQRFMAAPGPDADLINGMLKLNDATSHPMVSYDVDGAAVKTLHLADHLQVQSVRAAQVRSATLAPMSAASTSASGTQLRSATLVQKPGEAPAAVPLTMLRSAPAAGKVAAAPRAPEVAGLPALRSAGISVARAGRALLLAKSLEKVTQYNQAVLANRPEDVTFHAEDLIRGYRIDVWDSRTKTWHSLCRRKGTYQFLDANLTREYEDEGFVQMGATQSPEASSPDASDDLYLHESIFRWDGWSLCAPRPAKMVNPQGQPERYDDPSTAEERAKTQFKMVTSFKAVPGSLPRLRFGVAYRMRARAVDLAGNSLSLESLRPDDFSQTTPAHTYTRFEPVIAPIVVLTGSLPGDKHPGESLDRLVIRSNYDKSTEEYVPTFAALTANPGYAASSERLIAPPKTSQLMAERHGMFDLPSAGMKRDVETYDLIRTRADVVFAMDPASKCPLQEDLAVRYLPDPLARGASLVLLDRHGNPLGSARLLSFFLVGAEWPEAAAFRVRAVEGSEKIDWLWDETDRVLTVQLPKAEVATLQLSCHFGEGEMATQHQELMGVWHWIQEARPANMLEIKEMGRKGRHWMMTPSRDLVLIHPVQQPLIAPAFHKLTPSRLLGATYAYVGDDQPMPVDGKSTVKVDIQANWEEPLDDVAKDEPTKISGQAHVFEYGIDPDDKEISQTLEPVFMREVTLHFARLSLVSPQQAMAAGTQKAQVAAPAVAPAMAVQQKKPKAQATVPAQAVRPGVTPVAPELRMPPGMVMPQLPTKTGFSWRHDLGDTKYRKVRYRAVATTRFREYFPAGPPRQRAEEPIELTRESSGVDVDVPNSARPAAPKVLYVIPAFGWDKKSNVLLSKRARTAPIPGLDKVDGIATIHKRSGGILRVYLDRPWYSSGDGELLGIVVSQPRQSGMQLMAMLPSWPEMLKPYVTQWGIDPIWRTNPTPTNLTPTLNDFKNPKATATDLTLDELSRPDAPYPQELKVSVAGYEVSYDKERKLWYCDIELDPGESYYPFVRLALARFQPISVENAHLSRVIVADFAQLAPHRTATIVFEHDNLRKPLISVSGLSSESIAGANEVEVSVEEQRSTKEGDLGWIPISKRPTTLEPKRLGLTTVWSGRVELPKQARMQPLRLIIKEYERFWADGTRRVSFGSATLEIAPARRLVYADVLELPSAVSLVS